MHEMMVTVAVISQCMFNRTSMFVKSSAFWMILALAAVIIIVSSIETQQNVKIKPRNKRYIREVSKREVSNDNIEVQTAKSNKTLDFEGNKVAEYENIPAENLPTFKPDKDEQFPMDGDEIQENDIYNDNVEQENIFRKRNAFKTFTKPEVRHLAYLKVHKTGSSTTQNLFLRFGVSRNLTFLLASVRNNECEGYPNCISFYNTLSESNTIDLPDNRPFDILCCHVVYNRKAFRKYLPLDTKYISLVREPVKRLESAINFFNILNNTRLSTYAKHPLRYNDPMLNNRMAFEFGFDHILFPTVTKRALTDIELSMVSDYIKQLSEDFSLILVNERYHESLILMKRLLNWKTQDILYTKKLRRKHKIFRTEDAMKLKSFLYLDYLLYEFATKELDRKIALEGNDFMDEVGEFANLNKLVNMFCNALKRSLTPLRPLIVEATKWHERFEVGWFFCNSLRRGEISFLDEIRYRHFGTLNTP